MCGEQSARSDRAVQRPVHPRVCGEQIVHSRAKCTKTRFIPACAGNSFSHGSARAVRGYGSSPRVRGTAIDGMSIGFMTRFIPACAGNRSNNGPSEFPLTVHPRVCGEQVAVNQLRLDAAGSSPRVRGTVQGHTSAIDNLRFIPACAGNSYQRTCKVQDRPVHPRVCGEQALSDKPGTFYSGSSPRVRGTGVLRRIGKISKRFIPACAGNSPLFLLFKLRKPVHPRVCGEQLEPTTMHFVCDGSSPRVRGTAKPECLKCLLSRFIPACAGNSASFAATA